jgi:competence protein ComEA
MKKLYSVLLSVAFIGSASASAKSPSEHLSQDSIFHEDGIVVIASHLVNDEAPASLLQSDTDTEDNKIDINKANADLLTSLPGVGPKKAADIVRYRDLNGDFGSVEELVNVKGIGKKMVAKISGLVKV